MRTKKENEYFNTLTEWEIEFEKTLPQEVDIDSKLVDCWGVNEDGEDVKNEINYWYKRYAREHPNKSIKAIKQHIYRLQLKGVFGI